MVSAPSSPTPDEPNKEAEVREVPSGNGAAGPQAGDGDSDDEPLATSITAGTAEGKAKTYPLEQKPAEALPCDDEVSDEEGAARQGGANGVVEGSGDAEGTVAEHTLEDEEEGGIEEQAIATDGSAAPEAVDAADDAVMEPDADVSAKRPREEDEADVAGSAKVGAESDREEERAKRARTDEGADDKLAKPTSADDDDDDDAWGGWAADKVVDGEKEAGKKPNPDDSGDEWGLDWGVEEKKEDLMDKIRKDAEAAKLGWEKEWDWPEEEEGEKIEKDGDAFMAMFEENKEENPEGDEDHEYADRDPDMQWNANDEYWEKHSMEAIYVNALVQKIRSRTWKTPKSEGGHFPTQQALEVFSRYFKDKKEQQRLLLVALQWIEVNVLEVRVPAPHLSDAAMDLLMHEVDILQSVAERVPDQLILNRAGTPIPPKRIRDSATEVVDMLTERLREELGPGLGSVEDLQKIIQEILGHVPATVRVMALVHIYEFAKLKAQQYRDQEALAVALAKQSLPERAFEVCCRITLANAVGLAESITQEAAADIREAKISTLNRLYKHWQMNPSEEQLSQIHLLQLPRQVQVLLNIERDIEMFHYTAGTKHSRDEAHKELRSYLDFDALVRPYICEEPTAGLRNGKPLEVEGGVGLMTFDIARIRAALDDVFRKLRTVYKWTPSRQARLAISRTNWVARLSALLVLAKSPCVLDADKELIRLLRQESSRKLGMDVLQRFAAWHRLEDGLQLRAGKVKVVDAQALMEIQNRYATIDLGVGYGGGVFQPNTPANIGAAGTPMMRGARTPAGLPPGTPAGILRQIAPGTPGAAPGTPGAAPPGTPAGLGGYSRGPATPAGLGAAPATPAAAFQRAAAGTPAHLVVPATPAAAFGRGSMTPAGLVVPGTPAAASGGFGGDSFMVPRTPTVGMQAVPGTPAAAFAGMSRIPSTPGGAAPGSAVPSTPNVMMVPRTPAGASMAVPQTPAGAVPRTPGGPPPQTPAAPFPGRSAAATPSGIVPQTPRM